MMEPLHITVRIEKENLSDGQTVYVALCLELDIASQGETVEAVKQNVKNAVELFLVTAPFSELQNRLPGSDDDVFLNQNAAGEITRTVPVSMHKKLAAGTLSSIIRQSGLPRRLFEVS